MKKKKISDCLSALGEISFEGCNSLAEEFIQIKKAYRKKVLECHPDKGGDAAIFRQVQTAFEVLRDMYVKENVGDSFTVNQNVKNYEQTYENFGEMPTPSWDYYYEAPMEDFPLYRVENAKSGRSMCRQTGKTAKKCTDPIILQGAVRVGSLHAETGSYTRWNHLDCWRVPSKVWLGLPDPGICQDPAVFQQALFKMNQVLFSGIDTLNEQDKQLLLAHVMDKSNWAKLIRRKTTSKAAGSADVVAEEADGEKKTAILPAGAIERESFVAPRPGRNGAEPNALEGKRVVITGVFPEIGGGTGLSLGKDRVKALVESFGGQVTSSVSGKTDMLIVGKSPGFSKVSAAKNKGRVQLLTLKDLKEGLEGRCLEGMQPAIAIGSFSAGFRGNSNALKAPLAARALAAQVAHPTVVLDTKPAAAKKSRDSKPAAKKSRVLKRTQPAAAEKPAAKQSRPSSPTKETIQPRRSTRTRGNA